MKKPKWNKCKLIAWICIGALLCGMVPTTEMNAAEEVSKVRTQSLTNIESDSAEDDVNLTHEESVDLLEYLRTEIAIYMDTYQISPEMPDQALISAYQSLDSDEAEAAWNKANTLLTEAEKLSVEEAKKLSSDVNTKLCLRFYDLMAKINNPVSLANQDYYFASDEIVVNADKVKESSDNSLTVEVVGQNDGCGGYNSTDQSITIKNNTQETKIISFKWEAKHVNSLTIDTVQYTNVTTDSPMTTSKEVSGGAIIAITITTDKDNTSNQLTLFDFQCTSLDASCKVTISYDTSLGDITKGGVPYDGNSFDVKSDGVELSATPKNGAVFLGWINEKNGAIIDTNNSIKYIPNEDVVIQAIFVTAASTPWFKVGRSYMFDNLHDAATCAFNGTEKVIVPTNSGILPVSDTPYEIPTGVTLLLPYAQGENTIASSTATNGLNGTWEYANARFITNGTVSDTSFAATSSDIAATLQPNVGVNLNLTIPAEVTLNVSGKLIIGGQIITGTTSTNGICGATAGSHANLQLEGILNIKDSGILSVCGYILGDGQINLSSNTITYQPYTLLDHKGGQFAVNSAKANPVQWPGIRYSMQNIQAPIHMEKDAIMKGYVTLFTQATKAAGIIPLPEQFNMTCMDIISSTGLIQSEGMIDINYDDSQVVNDSTNRFWYDRVGRTTISMTGGAALGDMSLSINVAASDYKFNSMNCRMPIPYNFNVILKSGVYKMTYSIQLLPGATLEVCNDAELIVAQQFIVYDGIFDHSAGYTPVTYGEKCGGHYPFTNQLSSYIGGATGNLIVNGKLTVNKDASFGGVIQSTQENATIVMAEGSNNSATGIVGVVGAQWPASEQAGKTERTLTAQIYNTHTNQFTPIFAGETWSSANADINVLDSYTYNLYPDGNNTGTVENHTETLNAPVKGEWYSKDCEDPNKGHLLAYVVSNPAKCTQDGNVEYWQCSRCNKRFNAETNGTELQEQDIVIPATGHSYDSVVTPPTCTEKGYTTYTCTRQNCGYSYIDNYINATGHDWDDGVLDDSGMLKTYTCTVCKETKQETVELIKVDVTWGAMEFTYKDGTWNPSTHQYNPDTWEPKEEENKVTLTNNGNVVVNVNVTYTPETGYEDIDYSFAVKDTSGNSTNNRLNAKDTKDWWLTLSKSLSQKPEPNTTITVGTVTVTIERAQDGTQ